MFVPYGKLSTEYYNFSKPVGKSINGDIEYYTSRLKNVQGKILEAGVGTGRVLIPLLEKGYDVDGVDYSQDMINLCKYNLQTRELNTSIYHADLCKLKLPDTYDAIIMPTGSFCLLDDGRSALENFHKQLNPGGRIVLDLEIPKDWKQNSSEVYTLETIDDEGILLENRSIEINWIKQYTMNYLKYEKWKGGKLIESELQSFILYWYGIEEFKLLLEKIGFHHISTSSNYNYNKLPDSATEIVTFEAYK